MMCNMLQSEGSIEMDTEEMSLDDFPQKTEQLDKRQIARIIYLLEIRIITIDQIKKHFRWRRESFVKIIQNNDLDYPILKKGCRTKHISKSDKLIAINYRLKWKLGYKRCASALIRKGTKILDYDIRMIYEEEKLFKYKRIKEYIYI